MMRIAFQIDRRHHTARRLGESLAPSTGWRVESWVVALRGNPGAPVAQVQLFRHERVWCLWTGNLIASSTRRLGERLARARTHASARRPDGTDPFTTRRR